MLQESGDFQRRKEWLFGLLLVAITFAAYMPLRHAGFIWDDASLLLTNPLLPQAGGWYKAWSSLVAYDYVPTTITSYWIEWHLWGLNPLGYHIDNLLLHIGSALLLWRILARLKVPGAWLAAALFAIHPVNVESVAWVTQRKNTLPMLLFLATFQFYLMFEDSGRRRWFLLAAVIYFFALLGKTAVVPLPVILLALAWWRRGRINRRDILNTLPFWLMAAGVSLLAIWVQHGADIGAKVRTDGFWPRLAGAGWALWFYLGKALAPFNLSFVYPRWEIPAGNFLSYVPFVLWAGGLLVCWSHRQKPWAKGALLAFGYFTVMLLPVLGFFNIFFMLYSLVSDHWQYFAIIGPLAFLAAGLKTGMAAITERKWSAEICCAILLTGLGALTWKQSSEYRNVETLWRATIARNPGCWLGFNDLGAFYYNSGRAGEAIGLLQKSLSINPNNAEAHNNLGAALDQVGQTNEAAVEFEKALVCGQAFAEAERNLGDILLRQGRVDEAIEHFQKAISYRPELPRPHFNLATALQRKGMVNEAVQQFQKGLKFDAKDFAAHYNLGVLLLQHGRLGEAMVEFQKVLALRPDDAEAENNLGYALLHEGRPDDAIPHLNKALALNPNYAEAHYNLGNALVKKGQMNEGNRELQLAGSLREKQASHQP